VSAAERDWYLDSCRPLRIPQLKGPTKVVAFESIECPVGPDTRPTRFLGLHEDGRTGRFCVADRLCRIGWQRHRAESARRDVPLEQDDELYKDKSGKFRFRLKASNGQVIATGEAYETKASALNGIESVKKNSAGAKTDDQTD